MASSRRLAAIMFTDMVGSTASAQSNEAEALTLRDEQASLVRPLFAAYHGREIKSMGDGFLAEFDSALRAVQCAVDIQQHLAERNSQPGVTPIQLRIGVHLGDVEQRESDIFGDAVNIASRIEPLASPGGVCISGEVYSQVRNKIPNKLEPLSTTALKGVQAPVNIYRVLLPWSGTEPSVPPVGPAGLAVLPFTSISPDPTDEYFADGLTEELITVLSQLKELRVIARTSVMPYKSNITAISQIGRDLNVGAILEGSVRRSGNRLRITVQLIDVSTQGHTWAQTYDRELDDVFAVQTDIAVRVMDALKLELAGTERTRLRARHPPRKDSYLAYLKGRALGHDRTEEGLKSAKEQFEIAIRLDADNASAYSGLSDAISALVSYGYAGGDRDEGFALSRTYATRAVELDPDLAEAHASLGNIDWYYLRHGDAETEFVRALALNPSYPLAHVWYALLLEELGRPEEALQELALAEQADPLSPPILVASAQLLRWLGRLDEAGSRIEKLREVKTNVWAAWVQRFEYAMARSDPEGARQLLAQAEEANPGNPRLLALRADYYARTGHPDRAVELLREFETHSGGLPFREIFMADGYTSLGDLDAVFRWFDRALENHYLEVRNWRLNPDTASVRVDPRFDALLQRMKLK